MRHNRCKTLGATVSLLVLLAGVSGCEGSTTDTGSTADSKERTSERKDASGGFFVADFDLKTDFTCADLPSAQLFEGPYETEFTTGETSGEIICNMFNGDSWGDSTTRVGVKVWPWTAGWSEPYTQEMLAELQDVDDTGVINEENIVRDGWTYGDVGQYEDDGLWTLSLTLQASNARLDCFVIHTTMDRNAVMNYCDEVKTILQES